VIYDENFFGAIKCYKSGGRQTRGKRPFHYDLFGETFCSSIGRGSLAASSMISSQENSLSKREISSGLKKAR
jgi:hypothetical protein